MLKQQQLLLRFDHKGLLQLRAEALSVTFVWQTDKPMRICKALAKLLSRPSMGSMLPFHSVNSTKPYGSTCKRLVFVCCPWFALLALAVVCFFPPFVLFPSSFASLQHHLATSTKYTQENIREDSASFIPSAAQENNNEELLVLVLGHTPDENWEMDYHGWRRQPARTAFLHSVHMKADLR